MRAEWDEILKSGIETKLHLHVSIINLYVSLYSILLRFSSKLSNLWFVHM